MDTTMQVLDVHVNGLTFQCRCCGLENNGESVLLLHGFPETSYMWLPLLKALAAKGYRAVAPDLRGYSPGAAPREVEEYKLPLLVSDCFGIAEALGFAEPFHLVGHDWGACLGWACVELFQERLHSYSALAIPHFGAYTYAVYHDPDQHDRSTYIKGRVVPSIGERMLTDNDFAGLRKRMVLSPPDQFAEYLKVFSLPQCMTGAINWYRANNPFDAAGNCPTMAFGRDVTLPTLFIQGKNDPAVGPVSVELAKKYMKGEYIHVETELTHWMIEEDEPFIVSTVTEFIEKHPIA